MKTSNAPYMSSARQHSLTQILLFVALCLLLLIIIPLNRQPFLSTFQCIVPSSWSLPSPTSSSSSSTSSSTTTTSTTSSSSSSQQPSFPADKNTLTTRSSDTCDLFNGQWVPDPHAVYYTHMSCPFIQENRNCLGNGKPDTRYLRWKWRPEGCDLPRFDARGFLEMVRGKSLAFVGDSLARNHLDSLICILSSVEQTRDISNSLDVDFKSYFYENYNFTVTTFWSHFLVRTLVPPNHDLNGLWKVYLDEPDPTWFACIKNYDYVIISDGNWFLKKSLYYEGGQVVGCHSCDEREVKELTEHYGNRKAFRTAFSALMSLEGGFKGVVFLRTLSPDHFENGDWDSGGYCPKTMPYKKNETGDLYGTALELYKVQVEELVVAEREARNRGLTYKLMDVTQAMLQRPDGHPNRHGHLPHPNKTFRNDCVHWCLPGPVEVWNEFLYQMMITM